MPRGYRLDGTKIIPPSQKGLKRKSVWNKGLKGFKHTEETKKKISEHHKKYKVGEWLIGKEITEKHRENLRLGAIRSGAGKSNKGRKASLETRYKMVKSAKRGKNHWNWNGGLTKRYEKIRKSLEYKLWREAVFKRDNYTCVLCNRKKEVSGKLNADHIKPFAYFKKLRFDINNGRTLCEECHRKTDTFGYNVHKKIKLCLKNQLYTDNSTTDNQV